MKNRAIYFPVGFAVMMLTGCASAPSSTADFMRGNVAEQQEQIQLKKEIASEWDRGASLVKAGEKLVKKGEEQIKSAEEELQEGKVDVEQGNAKITEGTSIMQDSEKRFYESFPTIELNPDMIKK